MTSLSAIEIERIKPHASNVRRDLGDLSELAASIKGMGLLQPLTVAPSGDDYLVIAGHRRLAAAKEAGLDVVPCIIRTDLSTQKAQIEAMLVENLQRSDLTVMEEADAYAQLELLGVKEAAIAKATGRARGTIRQRLLLASLPAPRREQFEKGSLSLDGAAKCAKLRTQYADDPTILDKIDKAGTWMFSHGQIEREIQWILEDRKPKPEPVDEDDDADEDDDMQQTTVDSQIREQQRESERTRLRDIWEAQNTWLSEEVSIPIARGEAFVLGIMGTMARAVLANDMRQDSVDEGALDLAGIEEGQGEYSEAQAVIYCIACASSGLLSREARQWIGEWEVAGRSRLLADAGYELNEVERAIVAKHAPDEETE